MGEKLCVVKRYKGFSGGLLGGGLFLSGVDQREFYQSNVGEGREDPPSKSPSLHGPPATEFSCRSTVPGNRHENSVRGRISVQLVVWTEILKGQPQAHSPSSKTTA